MFNPFKGGDNKEESLETSVPSGFTEAENLTDSTSTSVPEEDQDVKEEVVHFRIEPKNFPSYEALEERVKKQFNVTHLDHNISPNVPASAIYNFVLAEIKRLI